MIRVGTFALAAGMATLGGRVAVQLLEHKSAMAVQEALLDGEQAWARVIADGLQIVLEGEAPNEPARLRAIRLASGVVDASRVISNMSVASSASITPPDFAIEILRNDSGVSLIGLLPSDSDRDDLHRRVTNIAEQMPVTDLLESASFPVPDGWRSALNFAVRALADLPRSKISVTPGAVTISASADSADQKRQIEARLNDLVPDDVTMRLTVTAPRPVVSPFVFRAVIDNGVARIEACTADTVGARSRILQAAVESDFDSSDGCAIALGVPSATWGQAVSVAIAALRELGGGSLAITDADVALIAAPGTDQALFDDVVGRLTNTLPDLFELDARLPADTGAASDGPVQFIATLNDQGRLQLRGRLPDDLTNTVVETYAKASFAGSTLDMGTRVEDTGLPPGWLVRVLTGLEALSRLTTGAVTIKPDDIAIRGTAENEQTAAEISGLIADKLGDSAVFSIDLDVIAPVEVVEETGPTAEDCLAKVQQITAENKILFDPGSATLTVASGRIMDEIADVLRECMDISLEVAGYTDSQGREEMNQRLSQQRADAVLSALRSRRVPTSSFVAVGFGEADPIADNETETGREANRRIEFHLVTPEAVATPEPETETEQTTPAPAAD